MQSVSAKLYPHKLLSETVKCLLTARLYNFPVELCNDFNYCPEYESESDSSFLNLQKPLLVYENQRISTSKAICFFFHRLRNENESFDSKLGFSMNWISWCESFESCIELLNRNKVIESLDELEMHLKNNNMKNRVYINESDEKENEKKDDQEEKSKGGEDKLSMADVFVYVCLKHGGIHVCESSWKFVSEYLERVHQLRLVQEVMEQVSSVYAYKNVYSLHVSKIEEKNLNAYVKKDSYFVTTAINYVNGSPHIGHAYELTIADAIARYHRNLGRLTFFTTGADEHGIKIANQAKKQNMKPHELCIKYIKEFQSLNDLLNIGEHYYTRTTNENHKKKIQELWKNLQEKGDIYLGEYEGWYNIKEEMYITENEAKLMNYVDPSSGMKLEKMKEPSYFFKMNKYQERLIKHLTENANFIVPETKRNEILQRLKEPLIDLSCSRTSFTWGIPVPDDTEHVMYVWMDALLNYYTTSFCCDEIKKEKGKENIWPVNVHVIGKDILWFHAVILPTILMAANIELPLKVLTHGFVLAADGKKMSKSVGNVIDPVKMINEYGADAFRYYLIKETKIGCDFRFDEDSLTDVCNSDLADIIGNLVHRVIALCISTNDAKIPPYFDFYRKTLKVPFNILHFVNTAEQYMRDFEIQKCCELTTNACRELNKYLTDMEPWKLKDNEQEKKMHIIRIMLEAIYFIAHYLDIFIPKIASHIFKKLNTPKKCIVDMSIWFDNLKEGHVVNNEGVLFKKRETTTAAIKMQKVDLRVCKIVELVKTESIENDINVTANTNTNATTGIVTLCTIQVEGEEKVTALLNLPPKNDYLNKITIALINMKPTTINNVTVSAIIPHVNNSIFLISNEIEKCDIGVLIKPKDYPVLVKQRDKLTKKDIASLNIYLNKNSCFFEEDVPLVFASTGNPLRHPSELNGTVRFF